MKKFLLIFFFFGGTVFAHSQCSPQLAPTLKMLNQLEETHDLLKQVKGGGDIKIKATKLGLNACNAAWLPDERTILVNLSKKRSQGSLVCSLVFELHNALTQKQFDYFDNLAMRGKITKKKYIEEVEYLEYVNALKTVQVLKKGVSKHVFPTDTHWPIASSFEEHFQIQKEMGHSDLIGGMYDDLSRSRGSLLSR